MTEGILSEDHQEAFDKCYAVYRCPGSRKQRGASEKAWKKLNPSKELIETIFQAILAQNRYQDAANESDKYNRGFSVWLNNSGWRDQIGSHSEVEKHSSKCNCGKPIFHGPLNVCFDCYESNHAEKRNMDAVRKFYTEHGLKQQPMESREAHRVRMVETANDLSALLYAACAVWAAIAIPFCLALWKDRDRKPWVKTLTEDLKPKHHNEKGI
jgi:hypothetical protein